MTTDSDVELATSHDRQPQNPRELHVVTHTHWDREWYHPEPVFRLRLVALIDALLEELRDASYSASPDVSTDASRVASPFLLDGQAILLADYLRVRPDRATELRAALAVGAIEAGPWYVLADNLIPCGEAIVRNLQAGRRTLEWLGARAPGVAYCPDSFGHPAAMPQIAAGFRLPVAMVWRGLGGASHPRGDTMWWASPDSSRVLAWHFPRDGYEFGSKLPLDNADAEERWARIDAELLQRAVTGVSLLPVGADHHAAQPHRAERTRLLGGIARARSVTVVSSSLQRFSDALLERAFGMQSLPTVHGELRDSQGYVWSLQGTFATRAGDKRRNALLERMLLHDVEPWCALAVLRRPNARMVRSMWNIWEQLLETHPHDTLCGCSVDHVARAMRQRQRDVRAAARELQDQLLDELTGHDVVEARSARPAAESHTLILRNRAARPRGGVVEVALEQSIGDVAVGPASAGVVQPSAANAEPYDVFRAGTAIAQKLASGVLHSRRESPQHYPDNDLVARHRALAWAPEVPATGVRVWRAPWNASGTPLQPVSLNEIEGGYEVANGKVAVRATTSGISVSTPHGELLDALQFVTIRDRGDSYTQSLRGERESVDVVGIEPVYGGPLRAAVDVFCRFRKTIALRSRLSLDADASFVRIGMVGENHRRNHQLRLHVSTGASAATITADAAFGPVDRASSSGPMPLHRWIAARGDHQTITLWSDGLANAEAADDHLAVTLVRAVGQLSRANLPERPGHAGWPAAIPHAQSIGAFRARFALSVLPAWSRETLTTIEHIADDVLLPLVARASRDHTGNLEEFAGFALEGSCLRLQAMAPAQDGEGVVLRIVNGWADVSSGTLAWPPGEYEHAPARLDESLLGEWESSPAQLSVTVASRAAMTLRVRPARSASR